MIFILQFVPKLFSFIYSSPLLSFHGFRPEEYAESLAVYCMMQEQIMDLEMEQNFTSDEEEEEKEENKEVSLRLSLFSHQIYIY